MFESKLEVKLFYYQGKNQKTNKESGWKLGFH